LIDNALPELEKRAIPAMLFIPTGSLGKKPGWITNAKNRNIDETVMSASQVRSIWSRLVRIGSHGVTHRDLTRLTREEAMQELRDSREHLEELLGERVGSFAFPFGRYDKSVLDLAGRAGYGKVFCSWPQYPPYKAGGFLLGRVDTSPDDWDLEFRLKIMGAYRWLPVGIRFKRYVYGLFKVNEPAMPRYSREIRN
ncbi:MAG: polysaccharide deacetylase family protein, partial [Desulfomonilia bacterium]